MISIPIVTIIDIAGSRKIPEKHRKELFEIIDTELDEIRRRNMGGVGPQRVLADTIEVLSDSWLIHARLLHHMLSLGIKIYAGIGTHRVAILSRDINKCDGPAFWNARKALENVKSGWRHGVSDILIDLLLEENTPIVERLAVSQIVTYVLFINTLRGPTRRYIYDYLWRDRTISQIGECYGITSQNLSAIFKKYQVKVLKKLVA